MLLSNGVSVNTIPDIANTLAETFAKTSSCDNYTPAFQALKRREERVKLNFSSSNEEGYNSPLTLLELRAVLHRSDYTAGCPDGLHYIMLWHLSESSILSLLSLFNRIWETQVFPTQWCCAHVLPFPKPERQIQTTINNFTKCAEQNGFVFSTEKKTVSVVFSRKCGVSPNPELFIGRSLIKVVYEFKFLGLIFHQSLRFHRHLKDLKIRSAKTLNILKVLANTRWGADRTSLLRLYRALIRSKLNYGSVVYSSACKSLLKILDSVHHQALRLCLGAFRTSPTPCQPFKELSLDIHRLIPSLWISHYALANHLKKKDIRFCWIPEHAGITGNELADTVARSATGSSERFPIPHSDLKACFRQKLQSVSQSNWDKTN
ncbi:RNase H domain-containing protein [Trichonephila inaurata madagascariensis]|uniref:RNase H domain-containing protein n=1 Tax=Trichonephila inaurata madagascariensis TaxID=2747483 RepID=A0A8X7C4T7_9ARAC|nr:RNase H domain-containing protein [Trichonephila inaurata madagascariensis]